MEDIQVSIDAYTLDHTTGKKRVYSIDQDGSLVYEKEKPPGADFASELERIWTEYPEGLLDLTEAQLESLPPDDDAVLKAVEGESEKEERDSGQMMSAEDMEALRSEVFLQLNDGRNELWYVLELAKTLASSSDFTSDPPPMPNQPSIKKRRPEIPPLQPGVEPPILPPGTYTTTASSSTLHPSASAYDLEVALAAKQQALEECSALIDGAVEELQAMAEAGDRFWGSIRELRDGKDGRDQWAILPRPDFGRNMAEGERAKDVIIPYALDEAPPPLRARSLAAFDLDPTKIDSLTFGARSHLRLRVALQDEAGLQFSTIASSPDAEDVRALMSFVQAEAFDEDLFNELRIEAMRSGFTVESKRIVSSLGEEEVVFELYDIRDPPPATTQSSKADLVLHLAHLSLLRLHRHRKTQLISQSSRLSPNLAPGPLILAPILQGVRYQHIAQKAFRTLEMFLACMTRLGIKGKVESSWKAAEGGLNLWGLRSGDILDLFGGEIRLQLDEMHGITLTTSATRPFVLQSVKATFPLTDPDELPSYLSQDLAVQLLGYAESCIHRNLDEKLQDRVFLDDLAGVITLPDACISISIPPPYTGIEARLEPHDTSLPIGRFDVAEGGMEDWLRRIAHRVTK